MWGRGPQCPLADSSSAPGVGRESGLRVPAPAKRGPACQPPACGPECPLSPTPSWFPAALAAPPPPQLRLPSPLLHPIQPFLPRHLLPRQGSTREWGRPEEGEKQIWQNSRPHQQRSKKAPPTMGNAQERPSETIDRERKRLVETLQADSGLLLDALLARGVLTPPEYEVLDALPDTERRVRRLLLVVQSKGEAACQELLSCAQRTVRAPDPAWDWQHVGPGYRERSYDPPCPGHWTPEAAGSGTPCPGLSRASHCDEAGDSESSGAVQSGTLEEPQTELEAEASDGAEPELEPQTDPEPEAEPEPELQPEHDLEPDQEPEPDWELDQEPEPDPGREPDCEAEDESEDS